jgi:hypothetical protein
MLTYDGPQEDRLIRIRNIFGKIVRFEYVIHVWGWSETDALNKREFIKRSYKATEKDIFMELI